MVEYHAGCVISGIWLKAYRGKEIGYEYICDKCRKICSNDMSAWVYKFCPNCGHKMKGIKDYEI